MVASFHAVYKLSPGLLKVWGSLLMSFPAAVIWIPAFSQHAQANVVRELAALGIQRPGDRLVWAGTFSDDEHVSVKAAADIALDPLWVRGPFMVFYYLGPNVSPR